MGERSADFISELKLINNLAFSYYKLFADKLTNMISKMGNNSQHDKSKVTHRI